MDTKDTKDTNTQHNPSSEQQNPYSMIVISAVMLLLGIIIGYFGRPLIAQQTLNMAVQQEGEVVAPLEQPGANGAAPGEPPAVAEEPAPEPETNDNELAAQSQQELMSFVTSQVRHFRGDPDAPVTMIEFSDFQCPFCVRFSLETAPEIESTYIDNGDVRLGYVHLAILGEASVLAAEASECAAEQDAFWPYHDRLIERLGVEGQRDFTPDTLREFAAELDLDVDTFGECLDSGRYTEVVQNDVAMAQAIGFNSTPSFLVGGVPVVGAQDFTAFQRVIESRRQNAEAE